MTENSVTTPPENAPKISWPERVAQIPAEAFDPSLRGPLTAEEAAVTLPASAASAPDLSPDARLMHSQFKMMDPKGAGIGLNALRPFYPKVGWGRILARVRELEDAGALTKRDVLGDRGAVAYQVYTWVEVS